MSPRRRPGENRVERSGATRSRRPLSGAARGAIPDLTVEETVAAHLADHEATVEAGITRGTERSRFNVHQALTRFERWIEASGASLGELTEEAAGGRRRLPALWVAAYALQTARPGLTSRASHRQEIINLMAGLRAQRIEVPGWDDDAAQQILKRMRARLEISEERPALPILPGDGTLQAVAAAIDEMDLPEVQRAALGALHALGFWGAGRASELVRHLRWRHITVNADRTRLTITWPAGCKFQHEDVTLVRGTGLVADPLEAVERLRLALVKEGVTPGPDDTILPGWPRRQLVLSPCDNITAAFRDIHGEHAEANMCHKITAWYRASWEQAAAAAGLESTATRRVSLHGLRRGFATAAALAGVPITEIQGELRHGNWSITLRYTDEEQVDMDSVVELIALGDKTNDPDPDAVVALAPRTGQTAGNIGRARAAEPDDDSEADPDAAGDGRACVAPGCLNPPLWQRNLGQGGMSWLCADHARSQALDPHGHWQALRVCDGLGCDLTYLQRRDGRPFGSLLRLEVGDRLLHVCGRCRGAALGAEDPTDLASWARRKLMTGELCVYCADGTPAAGRIPDGDGQVAVCGGHRSRWYTAGKPTQLSPTARAPITRRSAKKPS